MRRRSLPLPRRRQRGMALFVTLIMVTVMLLVLATISYRHQLDFQRSSQALIADQVILLALSGESWVKKLLAEDEDTGVDSLEDDWAQNIPVLPVEGGWLTGCVLDLQARFNLNNLGAYNEQSFQSDLNDPYSSSLETYLTLLALLELDSTNDRAAVIVDRVDTDSEKVAPGGAEDQEYSTEQPARLAANLPLVDLSELVTISGYSAADLSALRPYVTALPEQTSINVNTASRQVLVALALLDETIVDAIVDNRPFASPGEFYQIVASEIGYMTEQQLQQQLPTSLVGVNTNYFELNARVSLAGNEMALTSLLRRDGSGTVSVLARDLAYLPRLEIQENQTDPLASPCVATDNQTADSDLTSR